MKTIILLTVLLFGLITQKSNSQVTVSTNAAGSTDYIGYDGTHTNPLNFATSLTPQMTLLTGGDLNIIGGANGYMINGNYVLWNNGNSRNIFTGVASGNATMGGTENTLTGYSTGHSLTGG